MKILIFNESEMTQIGGINNAVLRTSTLLARKGNEVTVLSTETGGTSSDRALNGVRVIRIGSAVNRYLYGISPEMWFFLRHNLRSRLSPDIVHIHAYNSLISHEVAFFCRRSNIPYVFSPHYSPFAHNAPGATLLFPIGRPIGREALRLAERIVCISRFEASLLLRHFHLTPEKIIVIPNGIDHVSKRARIRRVKGQDERLNILYVGYLIKLKGVQYALRAMRELTYAMKRNAVLRIAGSGDYEPRLRLLARRIGVEPHVEWLGIMRGDDLRRLYEEADFLLLLSKTENYGTVVAESLALGTPAIVTTNSALIEYLNEPGCFGIEYPPKPGELAHLIIDLASREIEVGPFTEKIRLWEDVARDYNALYEELIHGRH